LGIYSIVLPQSNWLTGTVLSQHSISYRHWRTQNQSLGPHGERGATTCSCDLKAKPPAGSRGTGQGVRR